MTRHFTDILHARLARRPLLASGLALAAAAGAPCAASAPPLPVTAAFTPVARGVDDRHHVAAGHRVDVLLRWGDPVTIDAPPFAPDAQTPDAQARQFGYNADFVGFVPAGRDRAMLCVNHEYPIPSLMFPDFADRAAYPSARHVGVEQASLGASVVELRRDGTGWRPVASPRNRRVNAWNTAIAIGGPAAGHPRMRTNGDRAGRTVIGTMANCAGGMTPWGTYLTAEENFDSYFSGALPSGYPEAANHRMLGVVDGHESSSSTQRARWGRYDPRFDLAREPNEANRFGWIVEIDPLDPTARPVKRTALGRFKHEGAESHVNGDGRLVIYSGDDEADEHLYRWVSRDRVHPDRRRNRDLLDHGALWVARFDADGVDWLPLVHGFGPLTPANGFADQADVVIDARRAAKLLGATPMDRPEDVEAHPTNGRVYVMCTNNNGRTAANVANPRAANAGGHIIELQAPGGDHAAVRFGWSMLLLGGRPADGGGTPDSWLACPDNCCFDPAGRLWVATDQGSGWHRTGGADGLFAVETDGPLRGQARMFFRVPVGAEMAGPRFAPDGRSLFLAVQHPAADGTRNWQPFARASTFADPATRWPDFDPTLPPRPAVVMVTRDDGGIIGG